MAEITAAMVKDLRESTGAGMMDCKNALKECDGDMQKAVEYLREKGLSKAAKKADRLAAEGLIGVKLSNNLASLVEINSETDFVAKNDKFIDLVNKTVEQVQVSGVCDIESLLNSNIDGAKFEDYLKNQIATIGENLVVRRFATLKANDNEALSGYLHTNGRVGVIVKAKFNNAANKAKVEEFLKQLCMHIAAMKPSVLSYKDLDKEFVEAEYRALCAELEKENEELVRLKKPLHKIPQFASRLQITDAVLKKAEEDIKAELKAQNKPEQIWDKIVPGQMARFIADNSILDSRLTLMGQFYVMDDKKTIEQVIADKSAELKDELVIESFVKYEVGEGLEKKNEDFAAEVAAQMGN
ncbi:translation elongation factor Ts [Campylobacter sp. RM12647]|uniref:translation elongation factor Ts n=1 Tax=Campylobacter sp. RM12647 TaxID=2735737 RepID=UPI001E0C6DC7|nr:elongation factor Ts [Campylobacter sp. RM12647]